MQNHLPYKSHFRVNTATDVNRCPDLIWHAVTLLNNTKPHLQAIKNKLGVNNAYYLKISTQVVGNALHNIIEEVNAAQKEDTIELQGRQVRLPLFDPNAKIIKIKSALRDAWEATKIMDSFDMETDFKVNRYNQNRSILKNLCEQMGVSTVSRPIPTPTPRPKPTATFVSKKSVKENKELNFFVAALIIHTIWGIISAMNGENFFYGFLVGIAGWIIPINMLGYYILSWIYEKINE